MKKIAYINHRQLKSPEVINLLKSYSRYNWDQFVKLNNFSQGVDSHYFRLGKNVLPFKNDLIFNFTGQPAEYNSTFNKSFAEITDQRCQDLKKTRWSKPWLVLWSGGVDSTVIVSSILKNFSTEDRKNVIICCNRISVYEYPTFYYEHIEPNFQIIDSSAIALDVNLLSQYYVIDGEPADQLFVAGPAQQLLFSNPELLHKNLKNDPDDLIKLLSNIVDPKFADWFYSIMLDNMNSTNIPVESYYDFFWWYAFNPMWTSIKIRSLASQKDTGVDAAQLFFNDFIHWFDSIDYQQWAMATKMSSKWNNLLSGNKLPLKEYIYEYNRDYHYYKYKIKLFSTGHTTQQYIAPWFCILDDYTRLYLDRDFDQIQQLIPGHIQ